MSVERRRAVRADNPQVREPVVVRHSVHVVEDQRHATSAPFLALTAKLAAALFDALLVQSLLEVAAVKRPTVGHDLGRERTGPPRYDAALKVVGRDTPLREMAAR